MAFDLDNEELKATRKLHNQDDGLYEETSDKNVANIEDDVKIVKRYLENSAYKESNSDFFKNGGWEIVDLEIPKAMKNIIAEREQDKKRIQELEEQLKGRTDNTNKPIEVTNLYLNSIPKQVVRDKIKELKNDIKNGNTRYPYIEEHKIDILQELLGGDEKK